MMRTFLTAVLLLASPALAQEKPKVPLLSPADQKKVDEAITRGVAYLKGKNTTDPHGSHATELVLWTMVHAGVRLGDAAFDELFKKMMEDPLQNTYRVSLQAMILEEVDRVRHQKRIFHCAQFLVDNQCKNGQWSYGEATTLTDPTSDDVATGATGVRNFGAPEPGQKPEVVRKLTVKRQRDGKEEGDNSNSQYAALGLRSCHEAGIVLPKETIVRARTWWRESQHVDEVKNPGVATGPVSAPPAGWCYGGKTHGHKAYGTMTAGAVGSLAICGYLLGEKNPRKDLAVARGLEWMGREFTVSGNPGPAEHSPEVGWMTYYWLYAMERAGLLCGVETIGGHKWYPEGVQFLLQKQRDDGSWLGPVPHGDRSVELNTVWDTCFAILFLRRATRPLDVASTDRFNKK
jgi:hypothetical protein